MRMWNRWRAVGVFIALVSLAACGSGGGGADADVDPSDTSAGTVKVPDSNADPTPGATDLVACSDAFDAAADMLDVIDGMILDIDDGLTVASAASDLDAPRSKWEATSPRCATLADAPSECVDAVDAVKTLLEDTLDLVAAYRSNDPDSYASLSETLPDAYSEASSQTDFCINAL